MFKKFDYELQVVGDGEVAAQMLHTEQDSPEDSWTPESLKAMPGA